MDRLGFRIVSVLGLENSRLIDGVSLVIASVSRTARQLSVEMLFYIRLVNYVGSDALVLFSASAAVKSLS